MAGVPSGYTTAMIGVVDMMTGASADAAYEAAYGTYYSSFMGMQNAANQKVAAEANIAAITQDKINTDMLVEINQDHAEAQAKVQAAVTGVEGQSLQDTINQTEINSSVAKQNNQVTANQQIEQQLAQVYQSQSTLLAVDDPQVSQPSLASKLAKNVLPEYLENRDKYAEGFDTLTKSVGDILLPEG